MRNNFQCLTIENGYKAPLTTSVKSNSVHVRVALIFLQKITFSQRRIFISICSGHSITPISNLINLLYLKYYFIIISKIFYE